MKKNSYLIPCLALSLALGACKKSAEQVVVPPVPVATPQPTNEVLAFTLAGSLWISDHNGAQARLLAAPAKGQSFWFPSAAPDGSHWLAWLARENGTQDVVKVDLSGKMVVLTDIGVKANSAMKNMRLGNAPFYAPDGKRIIYAFNGVIWVIDANGYNAETIVDDGFSWAPAYSPDGKRIAYVNGTSGHLDLWVSSTDGQDPYQVSDFTNFSAGHPRWSQDGKRIYLTRSQGDESDIVAILSETDKPLADADVLTKDHLSAGAVLNPGGNRMAFSSAREDGVHWELYSADLTGLNALALTKGGGSAPAWMRVSTPVATLQPTIQVTVQITTQSTVAPTVQTTLQATVQTTAVPKAQPTVNPTTQPTAAVQTTPQSAVAPKKTETSVVIPAAETVPKTKGTIATKPKAAAIVVETVQTAAVALTLVPTPVPTAATPSAGPVVSQTATPTPMASAAGLTGAPQSIVAKAAVRLRYKAIFTAENNLTAEAMEALEATADEVKKNKDSQLVVFGPQDSSPVSSSYASAEARSQARAQIVANELIKMAGLKKEQVKVQPYSPPSLNGGEGTVILYINL